MCLGQELLYVPDYSRSNLQNYLRSINSHNCDISFCGFLARSAHGLATQVSMCLSKQRRRLLQADVDPREKNRIPPSRFSYANFRLPNYRKRHWNRHTSSTVPYPCKELRRMQVHDECFGDTTQLSTGNTSVFLCCLWFTKFVALFFHSNTFIFCQKSWKTLFVSTPHCPDELFSLRTSSKNRRLTLTQLRASLNLYIVSASIN